MSKAGDKKYMLETIAKVYLYATKTINLIPGDNEPFDYYGVNPFTNTFFDVYIRSSISMKPANIEKRFSELRNTCILNNKRTLILYLNIETREGMVEYIYGTENSGIIRINTPTLIELVNKHEIIQM